MSEPTCGHPVATEIIEKNSKNCRCVSISVAVMYWRSDWPGQLRFIHNRGQRIASNAEDHRDSKHQALYLEISPNDSRRWRLKYRFAGKEKRIPLDVYAEVSLKEAREKCDDARKQIAAGIEPSDARKLALRESVRARLKQWHVTGSRSTRRPGTLATLSASCIVSKLTRFLDW
jgi:hypothetical protein